MDENEMDFFWSECLLSGFEVIATFYDDDCKKIEILWLILGNEINHFWVGLCLAIVLGNL